MKTLRKVKIVGFKSIASAELKLGDLNVVIGANGSGKSNLIGVFRLLERVLTHNLQLYVASEPDRLLYHGRKRTPELEVEFTFSKNSYGFILKVAQDTLIFERERVNDESVSEIIEAGYKESKLDKAAKYNGNKLFPLVTKWTVQAIYPKLINSLVIYHFEDTSKSSPAKQTCDLEDNRYLRSDAGNLPAYLYWLQEKHPMQFRQIEEHIRLVAPYFDSFVLAPSRLNEKRIQLEWKQKGSDAYFDAYSLSDGTLRFICLATLLLQPKPPALILLDEPELGLHPAAIRMLAEMLEAASKRVQVLLATQSVTLLNNFEPKDVIVAENDGKQTTFKRLEEEKLKHWLEEFSIGELWEKNVIGGRP